jgi:hypothetical protein
MEVSLNHEIVFDTHSELFVSDVAKSLLANEEMVLLVGAILEKCIDGLTIEKIDVKFKSSTTNSPLKETLFLTIYTAIQPDLNKVIPEMINDLFDTELPEKLNAAVTALTIVIVIFGMDWAYKKWVAKNEKDEKDAPTSITGDQNVVIKIAGDIIGAPPEKIAAAVEQAIKPAQRNSIARRALDFIRPAKRERGASISGGGATISAEAIAEAPSALDIEMADDEESHDPYPQQTVVIHATDIDKTKTGWAGHLPGVYEKRLRMQLYPGVDPKLLFGRTEIRADIILASKPNKDGELAPYLFHVLKVYD